jgi:hypothetical protein
MRLELLAASREKVLDFRCAASLLGRRSDYHHE